MDQKPLWTSEHNPTYLRGRASELLNGHIIRYNPPPTKRADGSTSLGLNFPALAITAWVGEADKIAAQIARDLTVHPQLVAALREVAVLGHGKCTIGKPLANMVRAALMAADAEAMPQEAHS